MTMKLEEFQETVSTIKKDNRRVRYSGEMKAFAVEYAQERIAKGESICTCAQGLGIADATLKNWLGVVDGGFRQVKIKTERPESEMLTVVTPSGYRVEGLSMESAEALLRSLA